MSEHHRRRSFVRMFGSAVAMQAVLSATSFIVGLILIRRAPSDQYGYYVLLLNIISLAVGFQNTFIQPQMVMRMSGANSQQRADLVGGLYRSQLKLWPAFTLCVSIGTVIGLLTGFIPWRDAGLLVIAIAAILASLYREFFRMVLLAYRRSSDTLRADSIYAVLLVAGAWLATLTPVAAIVAGGTLGVAALIGGAACSKALWRFEPWNAHGAPGILRSIAPFGVWTVSGMAIHWLLSQGYNFLIAAELDVSAVAAVAATRLLVMPINLLSTGIGSLMLPTTTEWLASRSTAVVFRRLLYIAGGLAIAAFLYCSTLWWARGWVFDNVLKLHVIQRDNLALMWFAIALLMLLRDQLLYLPLARAQYAPLTYLTAACAATSLAVSFVAMGRLGVIGALWGVFVGELMNVTGLATLSIHEVRKDVVRAPANALG
jgi:O-antigen/teichoic acid export membrane protein